MENVVMVVIVICVWGWTQIFGIDV